MRLPIRDSRRLQRLVTRQLHTEDGFLMFDMLDISREHPYRQHVYCYIRTCWSYLADPDNPCSELFAGTGRLRLGYDDIRFGKYSPVYLYDGIFARAGMTLYRGQYFV